MEVCRMSSWLLLLLGVTFFTTSLQGVQGEVELEGPSESECRPYIEKALKELEIGDADDPGIIDSNDDDDNKEDIPTVEITTDDDVQENDGNDTHEQNNEESDENIDKTVGDEQISEEQNPDDVEENSKETNEDDEATNDDTNSNQNESTIDKNSEENQSENEQSKEDNNTNENSAEVKENSNEIEENKEDSTENDDNKTDSKENDKDESKEENQATTTDSKSKEESVEDNKSKEESNEKDDDDDEKKINSIESKEDEEKDNNKSDTDNDDEKDKLSKENEDESKKNSDEDENDDDDDEESNKSAPEEELTEEIEIPTDLRPRNQVDQLLKLDDESHETENIIDRIAEITLRELKKLYENAIKPLEVLYKYRDLSNRHFGDSEIFSKPLILFMGPWSGGKSSIINYLLNNEYNETALRTGAEPSPAYFNILIHGEEPEIIDGTELTADFTFSGLQKFGQGLEERLRGVKLPSSLLEKVDIVEIPGILEVRKQVSRVFPFNDACQWFIDRADIIYLVYDPSKLDVGPETEAILDQLKGREHQTRIILNKADQVKPEELMRVQGALIWNISPLMSSAQPPVMYTLSLWSRPYESWAPVRLLQAQERAFLRDLRQAIDRRIENKIASARRFAVRVRNHAKMVDCYLTTYYNHKSLFGNRKQVADEIIDHPQDYHIYEGLSTLTNISRYDLPDPDVYKDFFKLNPLYDFQQLSATCTYFRGCPINRLDIAIAYDLPELVGKHKRLVENALNEGESTQNPTS